MARALGKWDVVLQHAWSNALHPSLGQELVWFRKIDRVTVREVGGHADWHTWWDDPIPVLKRDFRRYTGSTVYCAIAESVVRQH